MLFYLVMLVGIGVAVYQDLVSGGVLPVILMACISIVDFVCLSCSHACINKAVGVIQVVWSA